MPPLISIITPCLNRVDYIDEAVRSVLDQQYSPIEHIVVDGGSTDGTLEKLRRYNHVTVMTGKDTGLYDAINKGIRSSKGELIGLLNSDDTYKKDVFSDWAQQFERHPEADVVSGNAVIFKQIASQPKTILRYLDYGFGGLSVYDVLTDARYPNTRLYRKRLFDQIGLFDPSYRIAGDGEFLLRAALAQVKNVRFPRFVYEYRQHPGSLTINTSDAQWRPALEEELYIAQTYLVKDDLPMSAKVLLQGWRVKMFWRGIKKALQNNHSSLTWHYVMNAIRSILWWPMAGTLFLGSKIARFPNIKYRIGQAKLS